MSQRPTGASLVAALVQIVRAESADRPDTDTELQPYETALKVLDLHGYRSIMAAGTWGFVVQAVVASRGYARGLDAGLLLLRFTDTHRDELPPREVEDNRRQLYLFVLDMLDRLDQWDAYLDAWRHLRAQTTYASTYVADDMGRPGMRDYVVRDDGDTWQVPFLWGMACRRDVIARKVRARDQGRRLGHLFHHAQDELTPAEIQRRLSWVLHAADVAKQTREAWDHPPSNRSSRGMVRVPDGPEVSW